MTAEDSDAAVELEGPKQEDENPVFLDIIAALELGDDGEAQFSQEILRDMKPWLFELVNSEALDLAMQGFGQAVGVLVDGEHTRASNQLVSMWLEMCEEVKGMEATAEEKLKAALTGAEDVTKMKPVGAEPPAEGALKATAFMRPLPKRRI